MQNDSAMPDGQIAPPPPKHPRGYTAAEAAEILKIHRNTVYDWIKAGVLTTRRIRRTHYIPVHVVRGLLEAEEAA